jgi:KilA-N domain
MGKNQIVKIVETAITIKILNNQEYISLTDIARFKSDEPKAVIANWMRLKNTILLLGFWESKHNPHFKGLEFKSFKNQAGENAFALSPQKWIETTNTEGVLLNKQRNSLIIK